MWNKDEKEMLYRRYRMVQTHRKLMDLEAPAIIVGSSRMNLEETKRKFKLMGLTEQDFQAFCRLVGNQIELEAIASEQRDYCRKWVEYVDKTLLEQFIRDGDKPMPCSVGPDHCCDAMCPNYDKMSDKEWLDKMCEGGEKMIEDYEKEHPDE